MANSDIDLSSLETKKRTDSIIYTNVHEKYGIDLFKKGNNTKQKINYNGLFANENSESKLNTDELFSSVDSKSVTNISNEQQETDYFSIVGMLFLLVVFVIIIGRFIKNEKSH